MANADAHDAKAGRKPVAEGADRIELTKLLYRYEEAAELISISVRSIRLLIDEGRLERVYVMSRTPRVTAASIQSYLKRKASGPARARSS